MSNTAYRLRQATDIDASRLRSILRQVPRIEIYDGPAGELYVSGEARVAVPKSFSSDRALAMATATRAAALLDLRIDDLLRDISVSASDTLAFRLVGGSLDASTPLGVADQTVHGARRLLASSATSSISPRRNINRRYHRQAIDLSKQARLWHTQPGSFVFPITVSLRDANYADTLEADADLRIEPFARRATRTLAQALSLTRNLIESGSEDPTELGEAVQLGLSREVVTSIDQLLKDREVESAEISFAWSQLHDAPAGIATVYEFATAERPLIRRLAKSLGRASESARERFTGSILQIGHDPSGREYFFVLDTYRNALPAQIRVSLSEREHAAAVRWYEERQTVLVSGTVSESLSALSITRPDNIQSFSHGKLSGI